MAIISLKMQETTCMNSAILQIPSSPKSVSRICHTENAKNLDPVEDPKREERKSSISEKEKDIALHTYARPVHISINLIWYDRNSR